MFTGIIQDVGEVVDKTNTSITIKTKLKDFSLGESVSVNGTCLTLVEIKNNLLKFNISFETLNKTNLTKIKLNEKVNLERALLLSDRISGHLVQGHVDTTGKIIKISNFGRDKIFSIKLVKSDISKYIVEKGSIAIDGISLTVTNKNKEFFEIVVLEYTLLNTNFKYRKVNDIINIEVDIIAKYIESFLEKDNKLNIDKLKNFVFM